LRLLSLILTAKFLHAADRNRQSNSFQVDAAAGVPIRVEIPVSRVAIVGVERPAPSHRENLRNSLVARHYMFVCRELLDVYCLDFLITSRSAGRIARPIAKFANRPI